MSRWTMWFVIQWDACCRMWQAFLLFMRPFSLYLAGAGVASGLHPLVDKYSQLWPTVLAAAGVYLVVRFVWRFFP